MKKLFYNIALSKHLHIIEVIVLANLYFLVFRNNLLSINFHPDESFWIVATSTRFDEFINGDFNNDVWNESLETFEVRPIPSYLVSIGHRFAGITHSQLPSKSWNWNDDKQTNIENGTVPNNMILYYSRLPMVILTTFSMLITVILLSLVHSRFAAYCFFAISFNNYFIKHLSRAMCESPLLLFSILSIVVAYLLLHAIKNKDNTKIFLWSTLAGIFCGIAGESKLNGLLCVSIPIAASVFAVYKYKFLLKSSKVKILLISILTILSFTVLTFVIVYPFFYNDTISRIQETFQYRQNIMNFQVSRAADKILPGQRANVLFNRIFSYPIYLSNNSKNNIPALSIVNIFITALGLYYVIKKNYKKRNNKGGDFYLILIISAMILCIPILFTPLDWERYYLFPIYFTCIFFSLGFSQTIIFFINVNSKQLIDLLSKEKLISFWKRSSISVLRMFKLIQK